MLLAATTQIYIKPPASSGLVEITTEPADSQEERTVALEITANHINLKG